MRPMAAFSRREWLSTMGAATLAAGLPRVALAEPAFAPAATAAGKTLRGAFIILNTPFTATGDVDWEDLTREALFVDRGGCSGIVWPQGSSGVTTLTKDERMHGMEVLAKAVQGRHVALVLGVQGKDIPDMLEYTRKAETLAPDAVIAMPPTTGTSLDDYRAYFRALAGATKRPVILQTSGGARNLVPSTDLIVELATEFPNFGYVKEESDPLIDRMKIELAHRPTMKGVFGASLGVGWLYEMRLGLDGVITGEGMYADLMAKIWEAHEHGRADEARDGFSKFLLMRNLEDRLPGTGLYIMKKRGVFKTTARRTSAPVAGTPPKMAEFKPSPLEIEEIEFRFAGLKPFLSL
jgi:1-pyrroline-4-hydroxy-2-carboxylate deaminase